MSPLCSVASDRLPIRQLSDRLQSWGDMPDVVSPLSSLDNPDGENDDESEDRDETPFGSDDEEDDAGDDLRSPSDACLGLSFT